MKIIAISDTHDKHEGLSLPDGEIIVHTGDVSRHGNEKKERNVEVLDIYLVGSKIENPKNSSDIDSVILIEGKYNLQNQMKLSEDVYNFLSITKKEDYHFKLFNIIELKNLARYDGFRLFEFQNKNHSLLNTNYLYQSNPCLDKDNFINSTIIQVIYRFIKFLPNTNLENFKDIVEYWIGRNQVICDYLFKPDSNNKLRFYSDNDPLFACFVENFINQPMNLDELEKFLEQYYDRFPHEYINKSFQYMKKINSLKND